MLPIANMPCDRAPRCCRPVQPQPAGLSDLTMIKIDDIAWQFVNKRRSPKLYKVFRETKQGKNKKVSGN